MTILQNLVNRTWCSQGDISCSSLFAAHARRWTKKITPFVGFVMFLQVCFLNISRATKTRYKPCASLAKRDLQTWISVEGHHITGLINLGQSLSTTAANRRCYCTAVLHCILGRSCLTVPQLALHKLSNHRYVQKSENPRSVTCWKARTACADDFGGVARRLQAPGRFGQLDLAFRLALSALLLCFVRSLLLLWVLCTPQGARRGRPHDPQIVWLSSNLARTGVMVLPPHNALRSLQDQ